MPRHLSAWARLVHVHLLASGEGVSVDAAGMPDEGRIKEIATSMGLRACDALAGLQELTRCGFLMAKSMKFPGVLRVRMLFAK
jgi:hypothetical protein